MKASLARYAYAMLFLMLAGYAFITLRGPRGIEALFDKQEQVRQLEKRIAEHRLEIEHKKERIRRLRSSPAEQELEIRERLKLVRPNEKIFIIGDPGDKDETK
jgi:cell division protein FtsB